MPEPRVVIVGGGFGGLAAAKVLTRASADVLIIDRRNHHTFQPLLYQVATAGLAPSQIAVPIRRIMRGQANLRVLLGEVVAIDTSGHVRLDSGKRIEFDFLIVATGALPGAATTGAGWRRHPPGLKSIEDATKIRSQILVAFERAEFAATEAEQEKLLTFAVIGGGPTGVELAGAIAELGRRALATDFRAIRRHRIKVVLVHAGPRLLPAAPPSLSRYAATALEGLGVTVRLNSRVLNCSDDGLDLANEHIAAGTVVWAAGVEATPVARWLDIDADADGRVPVQPDLSVAGLPNIFVVGDAAGALTGKGLRLPGVAPVAIQAGRFAGRKVLDRIHGRRSRRRFKYRDRGSMAAIGRQAAVVSTPMFRLTGGFAWLVWSAFHVLAINDFRNRIAITLDWLWSYVTFERGARLITHNGNEP